VDAIRHRPLAALNDGALVRLALDGRREAYGELARRAAPAAGDLLRRMGASDATADDVTQDALLAAHRYLPGFRGDAAFATWTARIAARLYVRRRRKEARWLSVADPLGENAATPSEAPRSQARLDLDRALAQLAEPERICVSLCHGAGFTQAEIAEALQLPLGTVKSHVARGLEKLRRLMRSDTDE
jgi:RNA polymerase sigma-70 factor (ECF subfamily)